MSVLEFSVKTDENYTGYPLLQYNTHIFTKFQINSKHESINVQIVSVGNKLRTSSFLVLAPNFLQGEVFRFFDGP